LSGNSEDFSEILITHALLTQMYTPKPTGQFELMDSGDHFHDVGNGSAAVMDKGGY
jgi:hypothetical protein